MKTIECLCLGTIGLIVAPWKFDVLKTSIFALEASLFRQIFVLRTSNFHGPGNYQPIVTRQRDYCLISVQWLEIVVEMATFSRFPKFCKNILMQMVIKFLRSLDEGHLRFLDFLKKLMRAYTTSILNGNSIGAIFFRRKV